VAASTGSRLAFAFVIEAGTNCGALAMNVCGFGNGKGFAGPNWP
jgi:hypothetical protein